MWIDTGSWIDLDRDGVLDLVLPAYELEDDPMVVTHSGVPWVLPTPHIAGEREFYADATTPDPTHFAVWEDDRYDALSPLLTEYELMPDGTPIEVWSEPVVADQGFVLWWQNLLFVGDMDGDARPELLTVGGLRMSASGVWTVVPTEALGQRLRIVSPVGDIDGDDRSDLVIGFSTKLEGLGTTGATDELEFGHAALYLGSPDGIGDPLWRFEPSDEFSAGRAVVRIPESDTLVMAVYRDYEQGEGDVTLAVMRGASTPSFTIDQRVAEPLPRSFPVLARLDEPDGRHTIVVLNNDGAFWFDWDSDTQQLADEPRVTYDFSRCSYPSWLVRPGGPLAMRGRHSVSADDQTPVLTWGWTPDAGATTWTDACGEIVPDEPPPELPPTEPPVVDPGVEPDGGSSGGCGCMSPAPAPPWAALTLLWWIRRGRIRR